MSLNQIPKRYDVDLQPTHSDQINRLALSLDELRKSIGNIDEDNNSTSVDNYSVFEETVSIQSSQYSNSVSAKTPTTLKYQFLVDRRNKDFPSLPRYPKNESDNLNQSLPIPPMKKSEYSKTLTKSLEDLAELTDLSPTKRSPERNPEVTNLSEIELDVLEMSDLINADMDENTDSDLIVDTEVLIRTKCHLQ